MADLDKLHAAVESASIQTSNTWIVLLTFGTYLAVTVGSVTHEQLLLEGPIRLPALQVELGLVPFFVVAPSLFLLLHLYLCFLVVTLARKARRLDHAIRRDRDNAHLRPYHHARLHSFAVTQLLILPQRHSLGFAAEVGALATVVVLPVLLLLTVQVQFLPYHDVTVTWWHRLLVIADVLVIVWLWPRIMKQRWRSRPTRRPLGLVGAVVIFFSVFVATIPDELTERVVTRGTTLNVERMGKDVWWLTAIFFEGQFDQGSHGRTSPLSRSLALYEFNAYDHNEAQLHLVRRDLTFALFYRGSLSKADFRAANLSSSLFIETGLEDAKFSCLELNEELRGEAEPVGENRPSPDNCTTLRHTLFWNTPFAQATFTGANLEAAQFGEGIDFRRTDLRRAFMAEVRLSGANLDGLDLSSSVMTNGILNGASLVETNLHHADLRGAQLTGADFTGANLSSADLRDVIAAPTGRRRASGRKTIFTAADLQGADLSGGRFRGAVFDGAIMRDADLSNMFGDGSPARLTGASLVAVDLRGAYLQGVDLGPESSLAQRLDVADIRGTSLNEVTPTEHACYDGIDVDFFEATALCENRGVDWTSAQYLPSGWTSADRALSYSRVRFGAGDDASELLARPLPYEVFSRDLSRVLGDLACTSVAALRSIAQRIVESGPSQMNAKDLKRLVTRLLSCTSNEPPEYLAQKLAGLIKD